MAVVAENELDFDAIVCDKKKITLRNVETTTLLKFQIVGREVMVGRKTENTNYVYMYRTASWFERAWL